MARLNPRTIHDREKEGKVKRASRTLRLLLMLIPKSERPYY